MKTNRNPLSKGKTGDFNEFLAYMRKKQKIQTFLLALFVPFALILLVNIIFRNQFSYSDLPKGTFWGFYLFPVFAFVSSFWQMKTSRYGHIYMISPLIYGALLTYGSPFAVAILTFAVLAKTFLSLKTAKRKRLFLIKENLILLVSLCITCMIYRLFVPFSFSISSAWAIPSIIALSFSVLVGSIISQTAFTFDRVISQHLNPGYLLKINSHQLTVILLTVMPLGLLISVIASIDSKALFLLAPIYMMYSSMKNYSETANEAKSAIEEIAVSYEKKDLYAKRHSINVARLSEEIAREMLLEDEEIEKIVSAAKLHDIGKIGIADKILEKGKYENLTKEEFEEIRRHPETGHKVMSRISWYKDESDMVYYHHEWFDGSGYPKGLKGEEIPIGARILALAEAYDSMATPRSYRDSLPEEFVLTEIESKKGTQFDPHVVEALFSLIDRKKSENFEVSESENE